jgi:septum formation protein
MRDERGNTKKVILASQSPRRSVLLREAGIAFDAASPRFDEPDIDEEHAYPIQFAESNAYYKASSLADDYPERFILGADTVVALDNRMYGKPVDTDDARRILSTLTGTTHQVITGVALIHAATGRRMIRHDVTHVTMRKMTDREMNDYLATREWEGKAGAYGIQDEADKFVTNTEGSFSNVVGLPIELVLQMLEEMTEK